MNLIHKNWSKIINIKFLLQSSNDVFNQTVKCSWKIDTKSTNVFFLIYIQTFLSVETIT
jgi:hypothetical protein